jgi:chromosome segregation ATPase
MDNINQLSDIITQLYELDRNTNFIKLFKDLNKELTKYHELNQELTEKIDSITNELDNTKKTLEKARKYADEQNSELKDMVQQYKEELEEAKKLLAKKEQELSSMSKVSVLVSAHKELTEKNERIKFLESQLEKYKQPKSPKNKSDDKSVGLEATLRETNEIIPDSKTNKKSKDIISEIKQDDIVENNDISSKSSSESVLPKEKKSKKAKLEKDFDPDNFEEINGYELIMYKKNYYLRDLETNELYDIVSYKPGNVVGLITSNGKVRLN